jgi:RecB family endonuclease NucS
VPRVDLLAIDANANLVVIEIKRTTDGCHMELQAIRYAAMVSAMTFERAVQIHALPPLAEQRRIVAKVDQLMTLVDELETQLAASRATGAKLVDAIVSELAPAA